jgi:hypothetical protein
MGTGSRPALAGFPALESGLGRLPVVATQQGLIPVVRPVLEGLKQAGCTCPIGWRIRSSPWRGVTVMPKLEPWFQVGTPREVGKGIRNRPRAPWQQRA